MFFFTPVSVILSWPPANFDHPELRGSEVWWVSGTFLLLATICIAVRLYTRIFVRRFFGIDDVLVILGFIFSILVTALVSLGTQKYDWDRHMYDMRPSAYSASAKILFFTWIAWGLAASFTRLSVLAFYNRLLDAAEAPRSFYWANYAAVAATVIMLLDYVLTGVFACTPVSAFWDWPTAEGAHCIDVGMSLKVAAIINTVLETIVATLPLVACFKIGVKKEQRWNVIGVLSLGYFVAIAGVVRTVYTFFIVNTFDLTWWAGPQWICSEVENNVALICACAAPLRPVIGRSLHRLARIPAAQAQLRNAKKMWSSHASSTNSGPDSMTKTQQIGGLNHDADMEDDWIAQMSRTIDLEGLTNDDFGYSVHITTPALKRRRRRPSIRLKPRFNDTESGLTHDNIEFALSSGTHAMGASKANPGSVINTKSVECSVKETIRPGSYHASQGWGATPAERSMANYGFIMNPSVNPEPNSWEPKPEPKPEVPP